MPRPLRRTLTLVAAGVATSAALLVATPPPALATPYEWLDASYGTDGLGDLRPNQVLAGSYGTVDSAGRALVTTVDQATSRLRRLTAAGTVDTTFGGGSIALPYEPHRVFDVQADSAGRVLVVGWDEPTGEVRLTRYTSTGALDTGFASGGTALVHTTSDPGTIALAERSAGPLVLVYDNDDDLAYLVAYTAGGALDTTWAPSEAVPGVLPVDAVLRGIATDGNAVLATGTFIRPSFAIGVIRFSASGAVDTAFGTAGIAPTPGQGADGLRIVGGVAYVYGTSGTAPFGLKVTKLTAAGSIDTAFGTDGHAFAQTPSMCSTLHLSLDVTSTFIYATTFTDCVRVRGVMVARFTPGGDLDADYGMGGTLTIDEIGGGGVGAGLAIGAQPGGQVLVALHGTAGAGVVRLRDDAVPADPGAFVSLPPARILDTRTGIGAPARALAAFGVLDLDVAGRGGVPEHGAAAVVLNVTVTEPTASGYITAFPAGTTAPLASNLNFTPGQTIPNLVTVKLGSNGHVALRSGSPGTVHLIADVAGYYLDGTPVDAGTFVPLAPARLLDTRDGTGAPRAKVAAFGQVELDVAGRAGVPASGAAAVVLNVTVTEPTAAGFITVYPAGTSAPLASNLNFTPGLTIPNLVTVKLGAGGHVMLRNGSVGSSHLVADVAGYYLDGTPMVPGAFVPLAPARLLDTRDGTGAPRARVASFGDVHLQVGGAGGVPANGAAAAVLNVTVTEPTAAGYITVYPTGTAAPVASNLNFTPGLTIPNAVIVKLGSGSRASLRNGSIGSSHLVADVSGYFLLRRLPV